MAFFPPSPNINDVITVGNVLWTFNGVGWVRSGIGVTGFANLGFSFVLQDELVSVETVALPSPLPLNSFLLLDYYYGGATWNAADKDADVTLSRTDTVATSATSAGGSVRGLTGRDASDNRYFEIYFTGNSTVFLGIGKATASITAPPGNDANGYAYNASNGQKITNNSGSAYASAINNTTVGVQLNAGVLTFYVQGVSQGTAFSGLTGTFYPMIGTTNGANPQVVATLNTGAIDFVLGPTPPGGATAWG